MNVSFILVAIHLVAVLMSCEAVPGDSRRMDALAGDEFWYLDREDRVVVTEDLFQAIQLRYAPLFLKEQRLHISLDDMRRTARQEEAQAVEAKTPIDQAKSNLDFIDRILSHVAKFEDTHFSVATIISRPAVWTPLVFQKFSNEVRLVGFSSGWKSYLEQQNVSGVTKLQLGLSLTHIDGIAAGDYIANLGRYIPASTLDYRQRRAIKALSQRNFSYPKKAESTWTFRDEQGQSINMTLPWIYRDISNPRRDALYYLKKTKILSQSEFVASATQQMNAPLQIRIDQGKAYEIAPLRFSATDEYKLDDRKILRLGTWEKEEQTYAVAELKTFGAGKVKHDTKTDVEFASSIKALKEFVIEAKTQGWPFILDLRQNNGGSPSLANELFSLFLPENSSVGTLSLAHRITRQVRQMLDTQNRDLDNPDFSLNSVQAMREALQKGEEYTAPYQEGLINTDADIAGFDQSLVVLLDSYCISACDRAASYFRHYQIGKTLGSHSNGTGAGMTWLTDRAKFNWQDSFSIFESFFPNRLFGKPIDPNEKEPSLLDSNLENMPTLAEFDLDETYENYMGLSDEDLWLSHAADLIATGSH